MDFQELIHDLLEAELGIKFEAFSAGADGGIDLRSVNKKKNIVVQCKHYCGTEVRKLIADLKTEELPKIKKLKPTRYIVATSRGLTPSNKEKIKEVLDPFVKKTSDVIDATMISRLLRKHTSVERTHYKLWLTSSAVLERVMHSTELCQTEFQIQKIRKKLPIFVQSKAYLRATKILQENRVLVISGQPGIGKSTLAEIILFAHMEAGYEPVVIQSNIAEGKKLYSEKKKQIFYFDDFLGQTYLGDNLERLGRNEDVALKDFIDLIRGSENSRFILTVREHILSGAVQRSERLRQSGISEDRCLIDLHDYRRGQKARILYNHLYFSDLPPDYKGAIVDGEFFMEIIDHDNFNPRLIEGLSSFNRVKSVSVENYQKFIRNLLENPEEIWSHAFEHQLSLASQLVLLVLYTEGSSDVVDLQLSWESLKDLVVKKRHVSITSKDFRSALKELSDAFLSIENGRVAFINPSARDFVATCFVKNKDMVLDAIESATHFKQIGNLWRFGETEGGQDVKGYMASHGDLLIENLYRLHDAPYVRWPDDELFSGGVIIDYSEPARTKLAVDIASVVKTENSIKLMDATFDVALEKWERSWWGIKSALDITRYIAGKHVSKSKLINRYGPKLRKVIIGRLDTATSRDWIEMLGSRANDPFWTSADLPVIDESFQDYRVDRVDDELADCNDADDLQEMKRNLEKIHEEYGEDFENVIDRLDQKIEDEEGKEPESTEEEEVVRTAKEPVEETATEGHIKNMFSSLLTSNKQA